MGAYDGDTLVGAATAAPLADHADDFAAAFAHTGIDIADVRTVYNYDLREVPDNYVHRIGRTARAGKDGEAIAFCCAEEVGLLNQIEKVMKKDIPVASGRKPEEVKVDKPTRGGGGRRGGRPQGKPAGVGAPSGNRRRRSRKPAT